MGRIYSKATFDVLDPGKMRETVYRLFILLSLAFAGTTIFLILFAFSQYAVNPAYFVHFKVLFIVPNSLALFISGLYLRNTKLDPEKPRLRQMLRKWSPPTLVLLLAPVAIVGVSIFEKLSPNLPVQARLMKNVTVQKRNIVASPFKRLFCGKAPRYFAYMARNEKTDFFFKRLPGGESKYDPFQQGVSWRVNHRKGFIEIFVRGNIMEVIDYKRNRHFERK